MENLKFFHLKARLINKFHYDKVFIVKKEKDSMSFIEN